MTDNPARDIILGKVRSALRDAPRTTWDDIPRQYARQRPAADLVALFCEHVADYRATVHRPTAEQVPECIGAILREVGVHRVLTPDGLPQDWLDALGTIEQVADTEAVAELDSVDGVVSTAAVGIASTGTIVLDHGPGQGRRAATLVPDLHVCVVDVDQIVDDVPAALARLSPGGPLTFVSGPSATSDIELDRVEGVHGPRTLHVIVASR